MLFTEGAAPSAPITHGLPEQTTRRITVRFPGTTAQEHLVLHYAATAAEAWEFTSAAVAAGLDVTVDGLVDAALRRLPCRSLWR
ncbi:hypothetical protein ACWEVD_25750 [Nocardia thailandica]|uniref:Uncharacterized protein n=1 Tax=Nocardia thailandica TaxID=257275 RepID=A0ABW6PMK5_9NOCA|nr:hypothetical protein [Nocardia thailandica]